jgi:hypothetical protein
LLSRETCCIMFSHHMPIVLFPSRSRPFSK